MSTPDASPTGPVPIDEGPIRCLSLPGFLPLADEFAAATGLTISAASLIVDVHIMRADQ